MNNILFITSNRLGDAVLSTGLIRHMVSTYPDAKITIACGPLPASIFAGVPNLQDLILIRKRSMNRHWIDLWKTVGLRRWDMVVDLRDSAVSRLLIAGKRYIYSRGIDKQKHKVEQCADVMKLSDVPAPHLWFTPEQQAFADAIVPDNKTVLAVGPTANWIGKTWPVERFEAVVKALTAKGGALEGAHVAVFAAPGEEVIAHELLRTVPKTRAIDMIAKASPGEAAAVLSRCDFYIGNDSGLMHCAAAAGVPTLGVFGPSYPHLYRPWGAHADYIATPETFDELTDFDGYDPKTLTHSLMDSLKTDDVLKKAEAMITRSTC